MRALGPRGTAQTYGGFLKALASFLLANHISIFIGIMRRPSSQIRDVVDADIWAMRSVSILRGLCLEGLAGGWSVGHIVATAKPNP